jgi:hypothetical protein
MMSKPDAQNKARLCAAMWQEFGKRFWRVA